MDYNTQSSTEIAPTIAGINQFRFWCNKVLPAVYDDSLSYYELLCKVIDKLNELIRKDNEQSDVINILVSELSELKLLFEQFMESGFDDYYREQVERWIDEHLTDIYRYTIKQIFFSLDDSGYLLAHIPKTWEQILFSTPMDYSDQTSYGRLCLTYAFDKELEEVLA